MLKIAAAHIYNSKKTTSRGELGELMLHLACILHFDCVPVVCKLIMKSSSNDTVKGFDGVHLLPKENGFELWLGESKFYKNPQAAIRDAIKSVKDHLSPSFLTTEKAMIFGHVGEDVPHREAVLKLFKSQTSGDDLLKMSVFPILIAYESQAVSDHNIISDQYVKALEKEAEALKEYFLEKLGSSVLRFQIILVPLEAKAAVVSSFDNKLQPFLT
jgi:hypothetical protein